MRAATSQLKTGHGRRVIAVRWRFTPVKSRAWLGDDDEEAALYAIDVRAIPFGAIVAVADLVACLRLDLQWPNRWEPLREHEHANGPFCWILENVRRVNPVPFRGAQGLFDVEWLPPCALTGKESKS